MIKTFWQWFFYPEKSKRSGWKLLFTKWLLLDAAVSCILTFFLMVDGFSFASKTLFPAASILVSMAIAWTARASTILNDKDFRKKVVTDERPIEEYVYSYQLSLLILISVIVYVALMAAGGLNFYIYDPDLCRNISSFWLYFLLSLAIRECWAVINFSNLLGLLGSKMPNE